MVVDAVAGDRGSNGQSVGQLTGLMAFTKALSLDALTAMVSIDSDLNEYQQQQGARTPGEPAIPMPAPVPNPVQPSASSQASPTGGNDFNGYNNMISASMDSEDPTQLQHQHLTMAGAGYDNVTAMETPSPFSSPSQSLQQLATHSSAMNVDKDGNHEDNNSNDDAAATRALTSSSAGATAAEDDDRMVVTGSEPAASTSLYSTVASYVSRYLSIFKSSDNTGDPQQGGRDRIMSNATLFLTAAAPAPASAPDAQLSPHLYFELCAICMDQFRYFVGCVKGCLQRT